MALAKFLGRTNVWKINSYTVNAKDLIGKGGYGLVYKAFDEHKNKIAVKVIDGTKHPGILNQDLERLLTLDHPNIVNIFDIRQHEEKFWIFMELCHLGDLNMFCQIRKLKQSEKLDVMTQIARGIEYLHRNNIIHRDIKPGNILFAHDFPISVRVTDFDVSKFLDSDIVSSVMSTDVGTSSFKAPEFFLLMNNTFQISYHRNVDIYSLGLTLLALLQADSTKRILVPQIETAQDESDLHIPVGMLIATRKRFKRKELDIVKVDEGSTKESRKRTALKILIKKMTHIEPEKRLSAGQVLGILEHIIKLGPIQLTKTSVLPYPTLFTGSPMIVNSNDQVIISGPVSKGRGIVVMDRRDGTMLKKLKCHCECEGSNVSRNISQLRCEPNYIMEGCFYCGVITTYNITTSAVKSVFTCKPYRMCPCLEDSLLVMYWKNGWFVAQLEWQKESETFEVKRSIQIVNQAIRAMCFVPKHDVLVLTSWSPKHIRAIKMSDGLHLWEVVGEVAEGVIDPWGLCSDPSGHVYVCDNANDRILLFDGGSGELLQVLLKEVDTGEVYNIHWQHDVQPHLSVFHERGISCFNVT